MVDTRTDETAANIAITMLHQYDVLITRLIEAQKQRFLDEGGIKEQMYRARMQSRGGYPNYGSQSPRSDQSDQSPQRPRRPQSPRSLGALRVIRAIRDLRVLRSFLSDLSDYSWSSLFL
jgi:four helix bundle suffix protein